MKPTRAERIETFNALRDAFRQRTQAINASYEAGFIDVQAWEEDMREQVKIMHVQAYAAGRGGKWSDITFAEWGRVGQKLRTQYAYLAGFTREVQQGNLSPAQMQARIDLYSAAARQQFEAALQESRGVDSSLLPAQPGDGTTACRCIVSPWSRVLTLRGWVPMGLICVGDYVWTHMQRWRRVTHVCIKESNPDHELVIIKTPGFNPVLATHSHRWELEQGWGNSVDIYNSTSPKVHVYGNEGKELSRLRYDSWKSEHARLLQAMLECVQLWESERPSGRALHELWAQQEREKAVGKPGRPQKEDGRIAQGRDGAQNALRRHIGGYELAEEDGRALLHGILGERQTAHGLSLPMAVDSCAWTYPEGVSYPPQERQLIGRQARELGDADMLRALEATWGGVDAREMEAGQSALRAMRQDIRAQIEKGSSWDVLFSCVPNIRNEEVLQLQVLWNEIYPTSRSRQETAILHAGMLRQGTALYDITVEEDHSFVIEGVYSHNTNCKCSWAIRKRAGTYICRWRLGKAEHCSTCLQRSRKWKNIRIRDGVLLSEVEPISA